MTMVSPSATAPSESLTFEQALTELETIVRRLEGGKVSLEDAIQAYERGVQLRQFCEARLAQARARIDQIILGSDGQPSLKAMNLDQPEGK